MPLAISINKAKFNQTSSRHEQQNEMRFALALLLITLPKAKASSVPSLEQLTARVGVLERELVEALPKLSARVAILEKVHLSKRF